MSTEIFVLEQGSDCRLWKDFIYFAVVYDIFCFNFNYIFFKEPGDEGLIFVHLIVNCLIIRTSFHGNKKDVFATTSSLHAIDEKAAKNFSYFSSFLSPR